MLVLPATERISRRRAAPPTQNPQIRGLLALPPYKSARSPYYTVPLDLICPSLGSNVEKLLKFHSYPLDLGLLGLLPRSPRKIKDKREIFKQQK